MTVLHVDIETRSTLDLGKVGVYAYFEHETTDVWCVAYAFDEEPVGLWKRNETCPERIAAHVEAKGLIYCHNAQFERLGWRYVLGPKHGWPIPDLRQFRCTMAMAYAMALPGTLDGAAAALGLPHQKDMAGHRLMLQMSRPRRVEKGVPVWWDTPEKLERLYAYCRNDVEVERALEKRLLALRPQEQEIWFLDQEINDRGVYVDAELCRAAKKIVAEATERLDEEMREITRGEVQAVSNVGQLTTWLGSRGVPARSVAKDQLVELLALDIPDDCRRALEIRREGAKTSTAKIDALLRRRCADGRMRGNLQYHGAGTGRWAARGAQLQNLPRPVTKDVDRLIRAISTGSLDYLDLLGIDPLQAVSDCIRGMISAPPGRDIIAADYSQIEARVLPWLAGDKEKLDVFRRGEDVYCAEASKLFGRSITAADTLERQIGKVEVLSLGYGGGAMAFGKMGAGYGLRLEPILPLVEPTATERSLEQEEWSWDTRGKTSGMSRAAWKAGELVKLGWRSANWKIVQLWADLEEAAIRAVLSPGTKISTGRLMYLKKGSFLWCRLPSGRALCYPYADYSWTDTPIGRRKSIVYKSVNQFTRKWEDKSFYGGLAAENATQAVARDVMVEGMLRANAAGYSLTMTIHDEVVAEVEEGFGSVEEFCDLLCKPPPWARGLPISADGYRAKRYRKG